tara:strand:- start:3884 stop:4249 length:366 start_codon:yes stop_codon:yes gene_type:complete
MSGTDDEAGEILKDEDDLIELSVGNTQWVLNDGRYLLEEDFAVSGEIWRVHKSDADPFPSTPHAHCIGGAKRIVGCTLHLGTAELFRGSKGLGKYLHKKQFNRLIDLIRPKFPSVTLPIPE